MTFADPLAISGKASRHNARSPRSPREGLVINALRQIYTAQNEYLATDGNGRYGTLEELGNAGLIDPALTSGFKYGFRFQLILYEPTETHAAAFTAVALTSKFTNVPSGYIIDSTGVIEIFGWGNREENSPPRFIKN